MPLYEYECEACGQRFEIIRRFSDPPADTCRVCGKGPVRRLISSPAIQFKGTGWYVTDYAKKSSDSGSGKSSTASSSSSSSGDKADASAASTTPAASSSDSKPKSDS